MTAEHRRDIARRQFAQGLRAAAGQRAAPGPGLDERMMRGDEDLRVAQLRVDRGEGPCQRLPRHAALRPVEPALPASRRLEQIEREPRKIEPALEKGLEIAKPPTRNRGTHEQEK